MKKRDIAVTGCIVAVLVSFLLPAVYSLRQAARPPSQDPGSLRSLAKALDAKALDAKAHGDAAAAQVFWTKSLVIWEELGHQTRRASCLSYLGLLALEQGDLVAAQTYLEEYLTIQRELGGPAGVANALHKLARVKVAQSEDEAARALFHECLAIRRTYEDGGIAKVAETLIHLGALAGRQEDWATARERYDEALLHCQSPHHDVLRVPCLEGLAQAAQAQGDLERARKMLRDAKALRANVTFAQPDGES